MLKIRTKQSDGLEIIVLDGEVDMYVAPKLRDALLEAYSRCSKGVAVDLSQVPYMDSSGIATLIEGLQWSKKGGGHFLLIGTQPTVKDTLKLAKLYDFFNVYSTEQEALASLVH